MKKTVQQGQNIFDVTLQYYGDIEALFDFLNDNDFDTSTKLSGGLNVEITETNIKNRIIVNEFSKAGSSASSGEDTPDLTLTNSLCDDLIVFLTDDLGFLIKQD